MRASLLILGLLGLLLTGAPLRADRALLAFKDGHAINPSGAMREWNSNKPRIQFQAEKLGDEDVLHVAFTFHLRRQKGGARFETRPVDLRNYQFIETRILGTDGDEPIVIGLRDTYGVEQRLPIKAYSKKGWKGVWETIRIPIADFQQIHRKYAIDCVSVLVDSTLAPRASGEFSMGELALIGDDTIPPPLTEQSEKFPIPFDPATASKEDICDLLEQSAFWFFWNEANPENGLIRDTARAFHADPSTRSSIASVGFGLTALCIGEKRHWISTQDASTRALATLKFFARDADENHGFFYHFYDMETGLREGRCEISSIDTGILLYGVLSVKNYFRNPEISNLADEILDRVDWTWMQLNGGPLSMGWKPEDPKKLIPYTWSTYNEGFMLYPLAIGSRRHPISPSIWDEVERSPKVYQSLRFVPGMYGNALFMHQYPQAWLGLRHMQDKKGINYFSNSAQATVANYQWCKANPKSFATFERGYWGVTASAGPNGYNVNGAPFGDSNGTVAPTAALGSFPFTPNLSLSTARHLFELRDKIWGRYGFVDAFNLDRHWYSNQYIGIDEGPIVLMIENERTGFVWDLVGHDPILREGLARMGFRGGPPASSGIAAAH